MAFALVLCLLASALMSSISTASTAEVSMTAQGTLQHVHRHGLMRSEAQSTTASKGTARSRSFCEEDSFTPEWADEFNEKELDSNVWKIIDSKNRADGDQTSVVAGLEVTACRTAHCRANNVRINDGKLVLLSERSSTNSSNYFTGAVTTKGHRTWADSTPYRMCVSAKLPGAPGARGQGIWPAHWMLPDNGISDACLDEGEMDIMEMINSEGRSYSTFHWMSSYPHLKCADFNKFHKSAHALTEMPSDWNSDFHEYGLERSRDHLAFAVDGKVVLNFSAKSRGTELSHTPFFLILNTAIGGGWPGEPTHLTELPAEHVIDYVRVARQKESKVLTKEFKHCKDRNGPSPGAIDQLSQSCGTPSIWCDCVSIINGIPQEQAEVQCCGTIPDTRNDNKVSHMCNPVCTATTPVVGQNTVNSTQRVQPPRTTL